MHPVEKPMEESADVPVCTATVQIDDPGVGLGWASGKRALDAVGGTIRHGSAGSGGGARFVVELATPSS